MQLLVGLGNTGDAYRSNRHNIGFMAVDAIARAHAFPTFRSKFRGLVAEGTIAGERVLLLKPQTMMNRSGDSVAAAAGFYKVEPGAVTVLYDELDLAPGKVRVKTGGGNGGHNGLRSLDAQIGPGYRRVRLGIGHPGAKERVIGHVLSDFHKVDRDWLEPLLDAVASNIGLLLKSDENSFMNKLALAVQGDGADRPERPATADPTRPKAQSHIHAARRMEPKTPVPDSGPMAQMLKRILGRNPKK